VNIQLLDDKSMSFFFEHGCNSWMVKSNVGILLWGKVQRSYYVVGEDTNDG